MFSHLSSQKESREFSVTIFYSTAFCSVDNEEVFCKVLHESVCYLWNDVELNAKPGARGLSRFGSRARFHALRCHVFENHSFEKQFCENRIWIFIKIVVKIIVLTISVLICYTWSLKNIVFLKKNLSDVRQTTPLLHTLLACQPRRSSAKCGLVHSALHNSPCYSSVIKPELNEPLCVQILHNQ